jgi:hypothetical protein
MPVREAREARAEDSRAARLSVVAAAWGMGSERTRAAREALRRRALVNMLIIVFGKYDLENMKN